MLRLVIWPSMMLLERTETKLWTLKYSSKSIQTSLILRKGPPKPYKLLKFFISFVTTVKSCHAPSIWKKMRWKSLCLLILKSIIKYFKSLHDFGGRCLKIKDICMDFGPYLKVHNLVSVHPKGVILGQMTNLNMVFHILVSVYQLVKILKLAPVPWWISEQLIIQYSATSQRLVDLFFSMVTQLDLKLFFGGFIKTMENSAHFYLWHIFCNRNSLTIVQEHMYSRGQIVKKASN